MGKSVSRVGGKAQLPAYRAVAGDLRLFYSQFEELEVFSRFGSRLDERTRQTLARGRAVREALKQPQFDPLPASEQIAILVAATAGLFDNLAAGARRRRHRREFEPRCPKNCRGIAESIEAGDKLSDADRAALVKLAEESHRMETAESLRRSIAVTEELQSVVKTMKALAGVNIRQYERAAHAVAEYNRTIEMGLADRAAAAAGAPAAAETSAGGRQARRHRVRIRSRHVRPAERPGGLARLARAPEAGRPARKPGRVGGGRPRGVAIGEPGRTLEGSVQVPSSTSGITAAVEEVLRQDRRVALRARHRVRGAVLRPACFGRLVSRARRAPAAGGPGVDQRPESQALAIQSDSDVHHG